MKLNEVHNIDEAMMAGGQEAYATEAKPDAYTRDQMAATSGFGRKPREHDTGDDEPAGLFTVVIDGRDWKTATSNEAFRMASAVARKHPGKRVQVRWPTGQLNTVAEALAMGMEEEFIGEPEHDGSTFKNSLHTIHRVAVYLNKNISADDDIPEWVAEKMGAAKGMLTSVMQYLISEKEMHRDQSSMFEQDVAEGSLNEFAVSGDSGGDDDSLFNYAKMWYNGDLKTQRQVEKALQKAGLDIGENEDENGGAYISDMSGDYYESWTAEDLEQGVAEGRVLHRDLKSWTDDAKSQGLNVIKPKNDLEWTHHATDKTGKVCGKFCTTNVPQNSRGFIHKQGLAEMDGDGTRDCEVAGPNIHLGPDSQVTGKQFTKTAQDLLNKTYADQTSAMAQKAIVQKKVHEARGDYKPPKEADYGDDYQDMVKRVAAQEKRKQQQQPQKKVSEDDQIASPASRELVRVARQSNPEATSDADAINAYMGSIAKKTQDNYKKVNDILRQLDPLSNDLDQAEKEINSLERVNSEQQHLLNRLNHRLGQATPKAQAQHQTQAAARAAQQAKDKQERDAIALKVGQDAAQQPAQVDPGIKQQLDKLSSRVTAIDTRTLPGDTAKLARVAAAQGAGKMLPKVTHDAAAEIAQDNKPFDRNKLGAIKNALATQQNEDEVYESRLYAMRKAGYDIL